MNEEWRPSPSFPGYEVSNLGRVRHDRRHLRPFVYRGRLCVSVRRLHRQPVPIRTLVAEAFCGLPSVSACRTSCRVVQLNANPFDCRATNLLVVPRRWTSEHDLRRASALRDAGCSLAFVEELTGVKASRLRRYRRREGRAARRPQASWAETLAALWQEIRGVPAPTPRPRVTFGDGLSGLRAL